MPVTRKGSGTKTNGSNVGSDIAQYRGSSRGGSSGITHGGAMVTHGSAGNQVPVEVVTPHNSTPMTAPPLPSPPSQPLQINYSQVDYPVNPNQNAIWIPRTQRYYDAWKLSPDNKHRVLHMPGAFLYSLFSQPKGSAQSLAIIGLIGFTLVTLGPVVLQRMWTGSVEMSGPGHETGEAMPDVSRYLPKIDYQP